MRYARLLVAKVILFAITPVMAQAAAPQTMAVSWFTDPSGSTGIVSVIRQGNPVTTSLYYSFCVETEQAVCQEGTGPIPNAAFQGTVGTQLKGNDVLTLLADTTGAGFSNWLCLQPNYETASCDLGTAPATGGLISVSWSKNSSWARITTANDKLYNLGALVQSTAIGTYAYSARMKGTVLGLPADTSTITTGEMILQTGTATGGAVEPLAARFAKGRKAQ